MPKPPGTYLHTRRIDKVALRAQQSKRLYAVSNAEARQRLAFEGIDLAGAHNLARQAHAHGGEPSTRGGALRKALGELVDHLNDVHEQLQELEGLHAELGAPMQEYRAVTNGVDRITADNVVVVAMAVVTLLTVLSRAVEGRDRRGA